MDIALQSQQTRTPPGRIGIWLFLASEIMFFMGLLVSYVLFRAADPQLFAQQSVVMNKWAGGINTLILLTSSFMMATAVTAAANANRQKMIASLAWVLLLAAAFLGIKSWEYRDKLTHYTLVVRGSDAKMTIYDGHLHYIGNNVELEGFAAPMPAGSSWDIHLATPQQVREAGDGVEKTYEIPANAILEQINDGPWKNMFFACYFTLTAVHAVHLIGGMIAAGVLLILATRGKIRPAMAEYIGIYWHFVDLVWIFLFVLLYLT
jgi:cytochrome c oxidase subunit 3